MRVLLIDDCVDTAYVLCRLLGHHGHDARATADGEAGIALAAAFQPDVVLLDLRLPRMDGYEVARRLRQLSGVSPRIIAVSGVVPEPARDRACGIDQHLIKPVSLAELQRAMSATDGAPRHGKSMDGRAAASSGD